MSADVYSIVTERMVKLLEAGLSPWLKTMARGRHPSKPRQQETISGREYSTAWLNLFASPY